MVAFVLEINKDESPRFPGGEPKSKASVRHRRGMACPFSATSRYLEPPAQAKPRREAGVQPIQGICSTWSAYS
jgi:hypothetical protein